MERTIQSMRTSQQGGVDRPARRLDIRAQVGLTFDDVLLVPARSDVVPREVDLKTKLTRNITINTPIVSAPMDTVTESRTAITMAQEGGIGIMHKNMPVAQQTAEVARVKKFESGIIRNPITISIGGGREDHRTSPVAQQDAGTPIIPVDQ